MQTSCPECAAEMDVADDVVIGEITQCGECGVEYEITATEPLTLEPAPEIEEDWGE